MYRIQIIFSYLYYNSLFQMAVNQPKQTSNEQIKEPMTKIERNNRIFAILTMLFQIAVALLFAFFIKPLPFAGTAPTANSTTSNFISLIIPFGYGLVVVVGFGLVLSYIKNLIWSGLGFTLLITAFSIQIHFLANALFTTTGLGEGNQSRPNFVENSTSGAGSFYYFALSVSSGGQIGNTMQQAFKCALANIIAFSAILGRGGVLQAWFITFFGSIGFNIMRLIVSIYGYDNPGTMSIFIYGGFMGLLVSLFLKCRETGVDYTTFAHPEYTANKFSATLALLGTAFIWLFFPLFAINGQFNGASFTTLTAPLSVVFAMASATFTSYSVSALLNPKVQIKDVIFGPIAGGIASLTASFYISTPVYALVLGTGVAIIQVLAHKIIQNNWLSRNGPLSTTSFIAFGFNGLVGAAFASGYNSIIRDTSNEFLYTFSLVDNPYWQIIIGLLCAAFGVGVGIIIGIFTIIFANHRRQDHFLDFTYWLNDDGIVYDGVSHDDNSPQNRYLNNSVSIQFKQQQREQNVKNSHAYL